MPVGAEEMANELAALAQKTGPVGDMAREVLGRSSSNALAEAVKRILNGKPQGDPAKLEEAVQEAKAAHMTSAERNDIQREIENLGRSKAYLNDLAKRPDASKEFLDAKIAKLDTQIGALKEKLSAARVLEAEVKVMAAAEDVGGKMAGEPITQSIQRLFEMAKREYDALAGIELARAELNQEQQKLESLQSLKKAGGAGCFENKNIRSRGQGQGGGGSIGKI